MSGPRITRKVTVEVSKKVTEGGSVPSSVVQPSSSSSSSYNPRRSVFERLGPGALDRSKQRDSYTPDKCRNWLRDGRCPYGNNCKFLHGPYSDQKPKSKSVRSIVHSGSKDRHDESDEKHQLYHSRSLDSIEFDEQEEEGHEPTKKKKRNKSDEDLSDLGSKKTSKSKKKHKEDPEAEDEDRKAKRKRKTHKKRDSSPKSKHRSPKEDEEDWDSKKSILKDYERQIKDAENWELDQGELDYDRQLELERRRQDLQRQLALMDEEDAAASAEDSAQWKGSEKVEEQKKVPIVHSRLHPEPSAGTPSDDGTVPHPAVVKKKKKKKLDSEGEGMKAKKKKDASPRKKGESKRKVLAKVDEDVSVKKENPVEVERVKKETFLGSSEYTDHPEQHQTKKKTKKTAKSAVGGGRDKHTTAPPPEGSPPRARVEKPVRKRSEEESYRRQEGLSPQVKPAREKRKSESAASSDEAAPRRVEEGRSRKSREPMEFYPSPDEAEDNRKVRPRVLGHARRPTSNERQRSEETRSENRKREEVRVSSRGPRTPSPPLLTKRDEERHFYEDASEEPKRKRTARIPRSPTREPGREDVGLKKDGPERERARHEDPHGRGPRTPSDDETHFSPPSNQAEATRSNRFSEREKELPRREPRDTGRERLPLNDQGDPRYTERGDFDRRRPREEEGQRSRRPPPRHEDYPKVRTEDDDYARHRGRDEDYPRETRDDEFPRPREGRDDRPEEYPPRSRARGERDEVEFLRGRARDERGDEGRRPLSQRDVHRRPHDEVEGNEREMRDERGRARADGYGESRSRERPDDRVRDPRYVATGIPEHYRRLSPSQGPPRGRSPPRRYDDRRRMDDGFRGGPGGRDAAVGRGRGYERGRGEYSSPYDNRGRPVDTRRRTPPPGSRSSFQDRDRIPPRGRDMPFGRGRGRPPNDRYREPGAPWERRTERDYRDQRKPFEEPGIRDRHPQESSPPLQGFRDQRSWEDRDRRGSPPRTGNIPLQERRTPFESDHEGRGRPEHRERHAVEGGTEGWDYEEGVNQRKRPRPHTTVSSRPSSPFESKKLREQSPASAFDAKPPLTGIPAAPEKPIRQKKASVTTKDGKKIKKKKVGKKEGKVIKTVGDGSMEALPGSTGVEEGKPVKIEKKLKKEKKIKEKGVKKKKKTAGAVPVEESVSGVTAVEEPAASEIIKPKLGKKRKQAVGLGGGEPVLKDSAEKPKKKKKKKHQPEVVVQPWADLEGEEELNMEETRVQDDKETKESDQDKDDKPVITDHVKPETNQYEMFSDWSDGDSPVGEDSWFDEHDQKPPATKAEEIPDAVPPIVPASVSAKLSPSSDEKVPAFDDVYDPISDDEFEAMYTQSDEEEEKEKKMDTTKSLGIEDIDWSSLGISQEQKTVREPVSHLEKFTPGHVFSRIGISPNLAGQRLTQLVQEACANVKNNTTSKQESGNELSIPEDGPKCIGAFVASAAAKKRERGELLGNLGPCRRALCARRDLAMRKQLGRSSKFGKVALFAASQSAAVGPPVDNELFQMSVALYKKDATSTDLNTRIIPSKVGSILLTQA